METEGRRPQILCQSLCWVLLSLLKDNVGAMKFYEKMECKVYKDNKKARFGGKLYDYITLIFYI